MDETAGDLTRRQFFQRIPKRAIQIGAEVGAVGAGVTIAGAMIYKAVEKAFAAFEQSQSNTTAAQKQAITTFNELKERISREPNNKTLQQSIAYSLITGPDGARLRSVPEPPNRDTAMENNNFEKETWEPNRKYELPEGAMLVSGKSPSNLPRVKEDWYFIPSQIDPSTKKVTGGYFSYSGNFR